MCGVCGIAHSNENIPPVDLLQTMARTFRHRGPDEEGYHAEPGLGFGFQRLAIIDLAGGRQPMSSEDGTLKLVFNGEIYNYRRLRQQLEQTGRHRFRTQSDTEVILHLYQEYGENCVQQMRGMFALAVWDAPKKSLFLARDRFGKKPLVYAELNGSLIFASELKALLQYPGIRKEIDYAAIDLYLSLQYIPSPRTIFQQIRKLPPAHTLTWEKGEVTLKHYWEPAFLPKTAMSQNEAMRAMMAKLKEAVQLRMIADVPLGAFLSGGKDSSAVVGLMSELSTSPVKTFSIGFEDDDFSELPYARIVAKRFGCDHHEFVVKADAAALLPKLAWHYGDPFADSSALPSYYVSEQTRKHVTVALNGDGGDESFAGYPRYQAMKFLEFWNRLPKRMRQSLYSLIRRVPDGAPPQSPVWRIKRLLGLGLSNVSSAYLDSLCFFREDEKQSLYTDFLRQAIGAPQASLYIGEALERGRRYSGTDRYLYTDMMTYLPECLMVKMDVASMANGLETRSPLLDHEFVELVASFPNTWKLKGLTQKKYLFNKALEGWLPEEIMKRPKQGFALPMSRWLRGPLNAHLRDIILSPKALSRGLFKRDAIERLLAETESGNQDHSYGLWALLMLEHWYLVYMDQP